jgi:hypothetical protein
MTFIDLWDLGVLLAGFTGAAVITWRHWLNQNKPRF